MLTIPLAGPDLSMEDRERMEGMEGLADSMGLLSFKFCFS
jgi:hypothetical protein